MPSINDLINMPSHLFNERAPQHVAQIVLHQNTRELDVILRRLNHRRAEAVRRDIAAAWRKYVRVVTSSGSRQDIEKARAARDGKLFSAIHGALLTIRWKEGAAEIDAPASSVPVAVAKSAVA